MSLYPLRFEPLYQYRAWGGRRLSGLLGAALPGEGPIGEAWILSDREEFASVVANGSLKGTTLRQLIDRWPGGILGVQARGADRFPLLLKFLDVTGSLSVQVHPSDHEAALLPGGDRGKTEGWVVLEAGREGRVFAGLEPETTESGLRRALADGNLTACLSSFTPGAGDAILIPAGTVHALRDVLVFEVQQNSDVTFRLYDWNRIDARTNESRPLQVDQGMACVDYSQVALHPVMPVVDKAGSFLRERLLDCRFFSLSRVRSEWPFGIGVEGAPHAIVCISGRGQVMHGAIGHPLNKGDVMLLPAALGCCSCVPLGSVTVLNISWPELG